MDERLKAAVAGVLDVPLHRSLGLRLTDPSSPELGLEIEVGPEAVNNAAILHGGLVPLLLDVASYLAVLPTLEPGTNAVTASVSASLLAAAPAEATIRCRGQVDRRGRSMVFCSATAHHGDRLIATGQVVKAVIST